MRSKAGRRSVSGPEKPTGRFPAPTRSRALSPAPQPRTPRPHPPNASPMKRRLPHQPAVTTMAALVLATVALELAGFRGLAIAGAALAFVLGVLMMVALAQPRNRSGVE